MNEGTSKQRGGVVGAVMIIALGTILLLKNLGVLNWSIWELLLRLWPILLVAAGLDLILGRRSVWGSLLALVLTVAVLLVALWLYQTGIGDGGTSGTQEIIQPLTGVTQARVVIDPGVGTVRVRASVDSPSLVEGTDRRGRLEELEQEFSTEGDTGTLVLRSRSTSFTPVTAGWTGGRLWDLQFSPRIPLIIETHLGVGTMDLDLTGLTVESLDVEQGIGQAVVTLPELGGLEARIEGAIGQTVVVIPEGLPTRVRLDTGIAARQIPDDFECDADACTSPGYRTADQWLDLEVSQAIGSLVVRH